MSEEYIRRRADSEIVEIRGQIKHLAENDQRLFDSIASLRSEYESGFKELRTLITAQNKPQWQLYLAFVVVLGGFFAFEIQNIREPLLADIQRQDAKIDRLFDAISAHRSDGHPVTVVARLETQERVHEKEIKNLTRWIKRIDENGSIIHYGPR